VETVSATISIVRRCCYPPLLLSAVAAIRHCCYPPLLLSAIAAIRHCCYPPFATHIAFAFNVSNRFTEDLKKVRRDALS
jgi:hypothetical protein